VLAVLAMSGMLSAHAAPPQNSAGLAQRVAELEAAIASLGNTNGELQARVDELEDLVRLLHRESAAVVEDGGGGSSGQAFTSVDYRLIICSEADYQANNGDCPAGSPDLVVSLTDADDGAIFTITSANDPDFDAFVAALSNGQVDRIVRRIEFGSGAAGFLPTEEFYFRHFLTAEAVDLAAYEIESIKLAVDFISITPDGSGSSYDLSARVFYVLAE
jgi:hypothetical protein